MAAPDFSSFQKTGSWRQTGISLEGFQELFDRMENLSLYVQKTLIVKALRAGGAPIAKRAAELAPDDPDTAGSRIRDNVKLQVLNQRADGADAAITVKPWNHVGRFKETGTKFAKAEPWLRPAVDEKGDEAIAIVGQVWAEGIEREMTKA